ncbi:MULTISPECIES: hypothetical protein [Mycobacteriaceae]|uniref:hypothetical protein n=1 Tax=Mycobacteriaceae TaxID=1762 RepID=UPI000A0613A2|nr:MULTISPECIES: hypothetical protein [Mycobacteriaceae]MBU8840226.1 hypothetical protein [Mycolicibacterium goodii]
MTWMAGHTTITELLAVGHLARISGDAANGDYLLEQGRQRLASARVIAGTDPVGAFELAYDGVRQAAVALLAQQGLRAKLEGGHAGTSQAVRAQFGRDFDFFDTMRRLRNQLEYPQSAEDMFIDGGDLQAALDYASRILTAAELLLPNLGIWQPVS